MKKETIISNYLAATEKILTCFHFNRQPDVDSVAIVTMGDHDFIKALREIYFSDNSEKDNYYKVIYDVISEANFRICKENFAPDCYSMTWRVIDNSLSTALSYVSELHFKETNYHFPFPNEQHLSSRLAEINIEKEAPSVKVKAVNTPIYEKFSEIFVGKDWIKYITALEAVNPPLLSKEWEFIGNRKKHIGVICSWFKDLQNIGIIKPTISRSKLASVLNKELKNFNMGSDGKTFDNISKEYKKIEKQLFNISK